MFDPRSSANAGTPKPLSPEGAAVQVVNPMDIPDWDLRVASHASATFFHSSAWASVLFHSYGYTPLYLTVHDRDHLLAALPIMEVRSWLTGKRGISLPFTDECGALGPDGAALSGLFDRLLELSRTNKWDYFECRGGPKPMGDVPASISYFGHRLDLRPGPNALFEACGSSTRRAVRKAEQSGLSIEFSRELDTIRTFHELLCKTRKRHGLPPQPFSFFRQVHRHILQTGKGWVALARIGQTPIAGAVFFKFGQSAVYKYGASDEAFQHLRANNLVMWESIQRLCSEGIQFLDFGRTSANNEGLRRFKLGWGPTECTTDYFRYECRKGCFVSSSDRTSGWYNRLFRILPNPISRLMGSVLYKHAA